jgi:hypothetical protein
MATAISSTNDLQAPLSIKHAAFLAHKKASTSKVPRPPSCPCLERFTGFSELGDKAIKLR